jgi:hypothetical protein
MEAMALFLDGLPTNSMVIFHGYGTYNQMVKDYLKGNGFCG